MKACINTIALIVWINQSHFTKQYDSPTNQGAGWIIENSMIDMSEKLLKKTSILSI